MLLSEIQVKYVGDIVVTRDTAKLGMLKNEVIQFISGIRKEIHYVQSDNH